MDFEENLVCTCDALTLLERLPSSSVTLAFLDPPWATQSAFSAAPYEELYAYLAKIVQQIRRVLTNEGSMFVRWSPASAMDVRLVMNQAFGEQPRYEITWHIKRFSHKSNDGPRMNNEFLLIYSKSKNFIYNPIFRPLSNEEKVPYSQRDEHGLYRMTDLTTAGSRPALRFAWHGHIPPPERSWRFSLEKINALAQANRIVFPVSAGLPREKKYLYEHKGMEIGTVWDDIPAMIPAANTVQYPGQVPLQFMERIVQIGSREGDLVLDPFCGSGTTLEAAQSLKRRWMGAENSTEALSIVMARLLKACSLQAKSNYAIYSETEVLACTVINASYKDVIVDISQINQNIAQAAQNALQIAQNNQKIAQDAEQIAQNAVDLAQMQQEVNTLTEHFRSLKSRMNIGETSEEEDVEETIAQMEAWITLAIANKPRLEDSYINAVCSWLCDWGSLDQASQAFLPQAEKLFEEFCQVNSTDFSPFILQYCRALENELLIKIFQAYTSDLYTCHDDVVGFLANDIENKKTKRFASNLIKRTGKYTLGEMSFIMNFMAADGQTLANSALLQDFRSFTMRYFNESILDKTFLDQISMINEDFRKNAAHPNVLSAEVAKQCRDQLRICLNELILNYKGAEIKSSNLLD